MPDSTLAIFDLDGTITRHDTLWPYVSGLLLRHPRRWWRLVACLPVVLRYVFGPHDRGQLKGSFIHLTLGGLSRSELAAWSRQYTTRLLRDGLYAEALACIEVHRRERTHLVLLSASPDLYVVDIARALGFDTCLCTQLRWRADGALDGTLASANRRGEEKVRCVRELLAERRPLFSHAYGNSPADLPHLGLVSCGTYVNGPERDLAGWPNVRAVRWRTRAAPVEGGS